ncbi:SRPBCC family protein [Tsukamurella sp. 8F]|uniref:type II toxin-antitoxin system Rv0910 family toxin n=1 Tax=unclassified Tsukamurella TaxID=2633480 RepID=UPI0023B8DCFE|nr:MULTISPECIES: SRPBCC family protein [unclassified Tsukamurella]MDF0532299.1 SRPBCC family protein [Tsukamurella sp. 8J]MDF0588998.1 SRPBCC family protein [Tsukamurella sp. 8F]
MAKVESTVEVPFTPEVAWSYAADLQRLPEWVVVHDGWRGELPAELEAGVTLTCVVKAKGLRNRVDWTITEYDPPRRLTLSGKGMAGTRYGLTVSVEPRGEGTRMSLRADLGGAPFFGPIGAAVARALKGDIETSLKQFVQLFG